VEKLIAGLHHFQEHVFSENEALFRDLAQGQSPLALVVTCSDSRVDPNLVLGGQPGDIFILRNAGNFIPEYGPDNAAEAATIEYAVAALGVRDLVVMGHSQCGAMAAALHPEMADGMPSVKTWLRHAEPALCALERHYSHLQCEPERLLALIQENVLVQLDRVRTHPSVARALSEGKLELHAWVFDIETGRVFRYSAPENRFLPLVRKAS
jgi:carbonic anhydrase